MKIVVGIMLRLPAGQTAGANVRYRPSQDAYDHGRSIAIRRGFVSPIRWYERIATLAWARPVPRPLAKKQR
jgi:hypothetical protein